MENMNKKTYMKKFSRVVRWRLQKSEADEVLNDYEEMLLNHAEYDNDSLIQELGEPLQAEIGRASCRERV